LAQYGSGIVSSLPLAAFSDGTPRTLAWVMAIFAAASAAMAWRLNGPQAHNTSQLQDRTPQP